MGQFLPKILNKSFLSRLIKVKNYAYNWYLDNTMGNVKSYVLLFSFCPCILQKIVWSHLLQLSSLSFVNQWFSLSSWKHARASCIYFEVHFGIACSVLRYINHSEDKTCSVFLSHTQANVSLSRKLARVIGTSGFSPLGRKPPSYEVKNSRKQLRVPWSVEK